MNTRTLVTVLGLSSFAGALPAQATHIVGPGGFAQIAHALAAAAPGDVILVTPSAPPYGPITPLIGVTIRGLGAGANIQSINATVPASQSLHLANLTIQGTASFSGGRITMTSCQFTRGCSASSTTIHVQSSTISGAVMLPGGGLTASSSTVTAADSQFYGRNAAPWISGLGNDDTTPGVTLTSSTFYGSHVRSREGMDLPFSVARSDSTVEPCGSPIRHSTAATRLQL